MPWLSRMLLGAPLTAERIVPAIDLARLTICGLGNTATRTDIENRLGPAGDYFMRRKGQLVYPQLGLQLSVDDHQMLVGFSVLAEPAILAQYAWGPGRSRGVPDEAWFVARLGPPTARGSDDVELMLEWTRGTLFIGVDFSHSGQLNDLFVDYR
ncbi:hypothetical protein BH11MYX3_BH11MYX3_40400 [soil metagenome]